MARNVFRSLLVIAAAVAVHVPGAMAAPRVSATFPAQLDALWDYSDARLSEQRFRESSAAWPGDTPQALEIATQIARAQGLQGRFEDAHRTLDAVEANLGTMPSHVRVRYLLERGRVFNSSGAPKRSVPLFRQALELAQCAHDDFYAIDAAHMLGIAAPPAQRLEWNLKALTMTEQTTDARAKRWLASLYNNIGWTYMDAGEPATALGYFRKAVPAYEQRGNATDLRVAHWAVGRALRATGELDAAERVQRAVLAELDRSGEQDGYVYEELAELALARGDRDDARSWFARAWSALRNDPDIRDQDPARLRRMAELGGIASPARP